MHLALNALYYVHRSTTTTTDVHSGNIEPIGTWPRLSLVSAVRAEPYVTRPSALPLVGDQSISSLSTIFVTLAIIEG
jgi:hypothetical protein